ncbi:biopolymer transporter ExbD [Marinobacter lipolyticus]|uniref:ExbD/TolR family protein n=1 Tax=Marinobacter lipolyticus TaxID=209639 RepID=UPI001BCC6001|nr:biopolymer transporter ExbD [Marinobacter lipolyticus]MBS8239008.1 biopolymer transporter ExbD [Marinobacter lipolyticus]
MKTSRRARRMQRHYGRMHRAGGLNLVSLMDIFTILVFFLMVNSSDVKVMQNSSDVALPQSTAKQVAEETLTVQVSGQSILVQGREVARLDSIGANDVTVAGLAEELDWRRERRGEVPANGFEVTIMASRDTDYRLLRKIMQTCVDQQYRQVKLAVESAGEARNG